MSRPYYTLIVRHSAAPFEEPPRWGIEFGDYYRPVVKEEMESFHYSYSHPKRDLKIIKTGDKQSEIQAAIDQLNAQESATWHASRSPA